MEIIPAIDIRKKKCVMLTQGKIEEEKIYSNDPVFIAKLWQAKGAKRLHVVDLDGAFCGVPQNFDIVKKIRKIFNGTIQFGGGVRDIKVVKKIIKSGIDKIIIGTLIVYNPETVREIVKSFPDRVIIAIDVINEKIAIGGWKEITEIKPIDLIKKIEDIGIKEIILTDVTKDGTLEGPNIDDIKKIAESCSVNICVSGGIGTKEDILKLKELENCGVKSVIIGKALYDETINLEEVLKLV